MTQEVPDEQEEQAQPDQPAPTPTTEPPDVPPDIAQTEFGYADHRLYAQAMYNQPSWVVDAVFGPGGLDPNTKCTPATVQTYINQMMQQPDKTFDKPVEV